MANQVVVTQSGNVQVSIQPTPNVQVQISRAAIGNVAISNVPLANFANYAGNVTVASQPNITSLGTLTGLTSSGNITAPFFLGNVVGNISGNIVVPGTNTSVLFNQLGNAGASDAFQFNYATNVATITGNLNATNVNGNGAGLTNLTGANVTGEVPYAAVANSVAGANVSGAVAYATTANSVAGANVSGQVAYAAVANSVAGANVSGQVNYAAIANSVAGANVTGAVANATYATTAGSATTANSATTAGTVTTNAQPNITSTGTLTGLTVSGDASVTNLTVTGNLSVGNLYANNANYANFAGEAFNVSGSNVTGTVANANYAAYAGNATIANSANSVTAANVSGLGNVALLNLDGNASNILYGNGSFSALPTVSNVANANYANFAGTAYSVSGANVAGDVAGANHANIADVANAVAGANVSGEVAYAATANSVALANVVGAGNIASINLDGNVSNALLGNGSWGPVEVTSNIISNGTSNVSIPVANGNIQVSVNGNANIATFDSAGTGTFNVNPLISQNNGLRISTVGRGSASSGASRLSWFKSRGTLSVPLSVQPSDYVVEVLGVAHNGTAAQTSSLALIRAQVDASYTANGANIPLGWQVVVNDTNGGINNQSKTHNFYANGNVVLANSLVVTDNITSTAGVFSGNANGLYNLIGANVTGEVPYANTANSVAGSNVSGPVAYASVANSVALANVVGIGNIASINLDGSSSNVLYGNGAWASISIPTSSNISNGTSNVNIPVANGSIAFSANNVANLILIENGGLVNAYPTSSIVNMMRINTFGSSISDAHRVAWARARGSNTSPTSVNPSDNLGVLAFFGHNGTSYQTSSIGFIRARVDASYTANGANIPIGLQLIVNDTNGGVNNQAKTHNFYSNGTVSFANSVSITNDITYTGTLNLTKFKETTYNMGNVSGTITPDLNNGTIQYLNVTGNITLDSLSNVVAGSSATLKLTQASPGNFTLTSAWKFAGNVRTLSTSTGAVDIISVLYDGSTYYATLTTGYV